MWPCYLGTQDIEPDGKHMVFPATPLAWAAALSTQSELDISQTAPFVLDHLDCLLVHSVLPPREAADFFLLTQQFVSVIQMHLPMHQAHSPVFISPQYAEGMWCLFQSMLMNKSRTKKVLLERYSCEDFENALCDDKICYDTI